jgi:hypothetical protein
MPLVFCSEGQKAHNHFSIVQEIGHADGPLHRLLMRRTMEQ